MDQAEIELLAENLTKKVRSHLISTIGRISEEASSDEFYRALCYAIREETMINWMATARTIAQRKVRMTYYLSLEYLPGRFFLNNITNLCSAEVIRLEGLAKEILRIVKVKVPKEAQLCSFLGM